VLADRINLTSLHHKNRTDLWVAAGLAVIAGVLFYLSTKGTQGHFDYTFRVAEAFLRGHAGLHKPPPSWLNEFIPLGGRYYSVFPFGAVLANIPAALLKKIGLVHDWPARVSAALLAAGCVYFFYRLSFVAEMSRARRILLALFPVFGTWTWANLGLAGAWQVALGFALLGETASLYFTLVRPRPLLAGACFALAIGNRIEIILTLPILAYFWLLRANGDKTILKGVSRDKLRLASIQIAWFVTVPALLLLVTAMYNYARFGSPLDFGYARIPGVLNEPWYRHGLFSFHAIPWNVYEMLFKGMADMPVFPYLRADPFGGAIFTASPFLFLLFREGGKRKAAAWLAIGALTLILWLHGNPGGWQFSYRYAMILLPWMFLLIAENGPSRISAIEVSLFVISVLMNALGVYEFIWANLIHV
jgi:hypothetical protein